MRKIVQMNVVNGQYVAEDGRMTDGVVLAVCEDGTFWRGPLPVDPEQPVEWTPVNNPPEGYRGVPGKAKKAKVPSNVIAGRNVDPARVEAVVQREGDQGVKPAQLPQGVRGTRS